MAAAATLGQGGRLGEGFCRALYARAVGINTHMARALSRLVLGFARDHHADTVVLEDLKGFRPRGGAKRSPMKQRCHGWLHRKLVAPAKASAQECGLQVALVHARGTSSWAYDGSGKLSRARHNHALAEFASGKQYNCDISAAYNIGARHIQRSNISALAKAEATTPAGRNPGWAARGRRTAGYPRHHGGTANAGHAVDAVGHPHCERQPEKLNQSLFPRFGWRVFIHDRYRLDPSTSARNS